MLVHTFAQLRPRRGAERFARQMINPDPRQRTKRDFQSAGPVNACSERILQKPAFQLRPDFSHELVSPSQPVGLREHDKVLVTIQLPNELVIPGARRVQERNSPEIVWWRFTSANRIAPP